MSSRSEQSISLVMDGKTSAVIITPTELPAATRRAVDDLASYVLQSSDATLPVEHASADGRLEIHVGATDYVQSLDLPLNELGTDGFMISFPSPDRIVVIGGSDTGTEIAVRDFIERYVGVRWLFPGDVGTYIPQNPDISIPAIEIVSRPAYISRTISTMCDPGDAIDTWLTRHRRHWTIQHHHNLLNLFDPSKYYDAHPEFYPLREGKPFKPVSGAYDWNPVLDAPGIADFAIDEIDQYFDANPRVTSYSLGINDTNAFDHPAARKNSVGLDDYSDYYFRFANAVAEGVLKTHPDKWFGCLAYVGITDPPVEVGVNERIVPYICIDRQGWASEEHAQRDMKRTEGWHKAAPVLGWYDYIYGGDHYRIPRIYPHLMGRYVKFGAENGVKAYYAELYASTAWVEGPKMYVLMKLLWDPSADVDQMLEEWYRLAVGEKAAVPLAKYYQLWEDYWMKRVTRTDWFKQNVDRVYMDFDRTGYLDELTLDDLAEAQRLMDEVVALAETPDQKDRATFMAAGFTELVRDVEYYLSLRGTAIPVDADHPAIRSDSFAPVSEADDKIPQPWGGWQNAPGVARFYWDHENGHGDSHSLAIDTTGGVGSSLIYRDQEVTDLNELYCLGAMIQSNGVNPDGDVGIEVRWKREDGSYIPRKYTANSFRRAGDMKDGMWTPFELVVRPPPVDGPLVMTVYLGTVYANKGIVRFDDVTLTTIKNDEYPTR
jgi:hypothetical protein